MILTNKAALVTALELGLVISVRNEGGEEMSRGYGPGCPDSREPDLNLSRAGTDIFEAEGLTEDGRAFLDLVWESEDDQECRCCCCTGECREQEDCNEEHDPKAAAWIPAATA